MVPNSSSGGSLRPLLAFKDNKYTPSAYTYMYSAKPLKPIKRNLLTKNRVAMPTISR